MSSPYPTKRPTDATYVEETAEELPTDLLNLPWIDVHNHAHTLSWNDRERYALAGCRAMVMVASGSHWTPYKPVRSEDVRYLWDDAINRRIAIERNHFFEANLALGIQTGVRVEDPHALLDAMDQYCTLEEVVAVGETGIRPTQQESTWPLEEQRAVLEGQMEIAERHGLPVVLHTPSRLLPSNREYRSGFDLPGFETNTSLGQEPVLDSDQADLEAVKLDIEAADSAGLADEKIVASHADPENVPYLVENTDCFVSFTIGHPWLTGVTAGTVAEAIAEYGPERIMLDTDAANVLRSDVFALKRAILELYRLGVDEDAIRQIVLDNPRDVFDIAD